jgi:hypothetical protein
VVAGGGGGAGIGSEVAGGGGGAGGYRTSTGYAVTAATPISVTVGAASSAGGQGNDSVFGSITSLGGGRAGGSPGYSGGSGGGSSGSNTSPGAGTAGQGNNGSQGNYGAYGSTACNSGGGGGAGAAGGTAYYVNAAGLSSSISGASVTYARGGAGNEAYQGAGASGAANTGDGGNGSGSGNPQNTSGGSGIVIMRYPDTFVAALSTTGSPTITVTGGYRIYKWLSGTGSVTF